MIYFWANHHLGFFCTYIYCRANIFCLFYYLQINIKTQNNADIFHTTVYYVNCNNIGILESKIVIFNKNFNILDGLELLMSITHHESESDSQEKRVFTDYQLKSVVEGILENHDKNDDGFMDFNEYITPIRAEDRQKQKR